MMPIHSTLANLDLRPRKSAEQYQALYGELKNLAKAEDNRSNDDSFRAGEVYIRGGQDDTYLSFGYQRDEGYVGEHLSVSQTQLDSDGKRQSGVTLRAEPTDKSARYLKFEHLTNTDADLDYEEKTIVLVDTQQGTLFLQQGPI